MNVEARQAAGTCDQENESGNQAELRETEMQFLAGYICKRAESPHKGQDGRGHAEGNHIGKRIQLPPEITGGVGHARNAAIKAVGNYGDANRHCSVVKVPGILGITQHGLRNRVIAGSEGCSKYFILGKLDVDDPHALTAAMESLRAQLLADPYFRGVPSMQPAATLAERAAAAGVPIHHLGPAFHAGSGLMRAIGRGERFHAADSLEAITELALRLLDAPREFVYGYHPRLDTAGHVYGVRSQAWRDELTVVDRAVRLLAEQLLPGTLLVVTGDHGMVDLRPSERLDLADHPELASGVRVLAGEARARYITTVPGATADVLTAWRSVLGGRMWIWGREEAIATGIFGPRVTERARERIGDVVAAAYARVGIVQRDVDPAQARLNGHHGSLTTAEQIVPLLRYRS